MCSIKQQCCYSFWRQQDSGPTGPAIIITADNFGAAGLRVQHYNTTAALRKQEAVF